MLRLFVAIELTAQVRATLADVQAEAILNMRLRNLRRLEEMEIRAERASLTEERADLAALGSTVEVHVSTIVTDPWTGHVGSSR